LPFDLRDYLARLIRTHPIVIFWTGDANPADSLVAIVVAPGSTHSG
jgi:hypothetical protein